MNKKICKKITSILFLVFILLIQGKCVFSQDINFNWVHENHEEVDGYNFYVQTFPSNEFVKVWSGQEMKYIFKAEEGTKYGFCVTAYNEFAESLRSTIIVYTSEGNSGTIVIPSRPNITINF